MRFDESKHPRADDGKFTDGSGTGKKAYDSRDTFGNLTRNLPEGARAAIDKATKELEREQRREIERGRVIEIDAATGEQKPRAFESKKSAREYFKERSKKWEASLSDDEKVSVKGYTDRTYDMINTYLRNPKEARYFRSFNQAAVEKQIREIDSAIDKFELDEDIKTYRGTNLIEFGRDIYSADDLESLIGKEITMKGYSSTSTEISVAEDDFDGEVLIEYTVPKGRGRGAYMDYVTVIDNVPDNDRESEFVLKRDSQIIIDEIKTREDGKIIVKARVK